MSVVQSISLFRAEAITLNFTVQPVEDITGWTILFTAANTFNVSEKIIQITAVIMDGAAGRFTIPINSIQTDIPPDMYVYDVWKTSPGEARCLSIGNFEIHTNARVPAGVVGRGFPPLVHAVEHEPGGSDPLLVDQESNVGSLRTLGIGPLQAASGSDPRFTNSRIPTSHAYTHGISGPDSIFITQNQVSGLLTTLSGKIEINDPRLTNPRVPTTHGLSHKVGQSDAISVTTLDGYPEAVTELVTTFLRADRKFATIDATHIATGILPDERIGVNIARVSEVEALIVDETIQLFETIRDRGIQVGNISERGRSVAAGYWQDVPPNATNFGGKGEMIWLAQPLANRYTLIGNTMIWSIIVSGLLGGKVSDAVWITIPGGFVHKGHNPHPITEILNEGVSLRGVILSNGSNKVEITRTPRQNYVPGNLSVMFTVMLEVMLENE